jgi:mono/diheme cytochrome c family protein
MRRVITLMMLCIASMSFAADKLVFESQPGPGKGKHIVLISGDEEYRSEETSPMLAKILNKRFGFKTTVLFAINPETGNIDPNFQKNIPGMEALKTADVVIIGTRFRDLPDTQLQHFVDYLDAGKPIIGYRTATHGFKTKSKLGGIDWGNFGIEILGEGWAGHYGHHKHEGARGQAVAKNAKHPVLNSVSDIFVTSDVYGVKRINAENATILLEAVVTETLEQSSKDKAGKVPQASAWLRTYKTPNGKKGTAFTTTMGSSIDFANEGLRRMAINAVFFLAGLEVPAKANVEVIDTYKPSFYSVNKGKDYYTQLKLKVEDYGYGKNRQTGPTFKQVIDARDAKAKSKQGSKKKQGALINPKKGQSIVFIGNTLAERMTYYGQFETLLHATFPTLNLTHRNMGKPGFTPAFRPEAGTNNPWAFPGAEKFRPEIKGHNGKGHYPSQDEWLKTVKADTIVAFFGFNESFDGEAGVANFKAELAAFIDHTKKQSYNGKSAPQIILATPIPMEQKKGLFLPDASKMSQQIWAYALAIKEVAKAKKVAVIDIFNPMRNEFGNGPSLTVNGVHLNDAGYKALAPILMKSLFGKSAVSKNDLLHKAVVDKDWFWRNDYRMLNGVHVYGGRYKPYGNVNYPEEIEKIRQMTILRDQNIWKIVQGKSATLKVADVTTKKLSVIKTNYKHKIKYLDTKEASTRFDLPEGYKMELFASEETFPLLQNPAQMQFDNKGRLWVSVCPSYPHYKPGAEKPNDKILIFEDTTGDNKADKMTVFADGLHMPIGFELAPEGVYLSQEPNLVLLKDTNNDGKADSKEYLVGGFDPHDTHHAISAFGIDGQGGIFMCEGRFLHSQVETPYGVQRMSDGGLWRYDPKSCKVERVSQSDYSNPWGIALDQYGQSFLNDASGGSHYWLLPLTVKVPHNYEIKKVEKLNYEHKVRPTSGAEFVYSSHFPEEVQGDYLFCNTIGFLGIKQMDIFEDGIGIRSKHRQDLLRSQDSNFRPCDLEFAPDGSLYMIDWHNALIGHMQHSARDPNRNNVYGRVYRMTYPSRPLVKAPVIADAPIETLLDNLKLYEFQARKRTQRELRGRNTTEVKAAVKKWVAALDKTDKEYDRLVLEALWVTWGHNSIDTDILEMCLTAKTPQVRAGAVRVVRHSAHLLKNEVALLKRAAQDKFGRVRLEALAAGSWVGGEDGASIALEVAKKPVDRWMAPSLNASMLLLKPYAESLVKSGKLDKAKVPNFDNVVAGKITGFDYVAPVKRVKSSLRGKDKELFNIGKEIYKRDGYCNTCHQKDGRGLPGIYPPIMKSDWIHNDERLIKLTLHGLFGKIVVNGKTYDPSKGVPPMTAFAGMLSDKEIAGVLTYIRNDWGNKGKAIRPEQVKKIREATKDRKIFYNPDVLLKEHPLKKK